MMTDTGPKGDIFNGIGWGTHICQFYETARDLLDILVPYFKKGIENNAQCLWLSTARSGDEELLSTLRETIPDIDGCVRKGQLEVVAHTDWYLQPDEFSAAALLDRGSARLNHALAGGYTGMWVAADIGWITQGDWQTLNLHEETICRRIPTSPVVALCAYPSREYRVSDVLNVFKNHQSVLVKQEGEWKLVESLEQMRIESALEKSEQRYKHLFDSVLEGMEVVDAATRRIVLANEACAGIFGFDSPEEMVGIDPLEYVIGEDREYIARLTTDAVFKKDLHKVMEVKVMTKDGRQVWVSALGVRTEYDGRLAELVSLRDITAQKLAEKAARESEERMRLLIDSANESILIIQDWKVAYANRRFEEAIGIPRQTLAGLHILNLTHPDDRQAVSERYQKTMNGERFSTGAPLKGLDKNGKARWADVRAIPFMWEERPAVMALMHDITEHRKTDEILRASEEKYRILTEKTNDIIWTADLSLRMTYITPSIEKVLGFTPDERLAHEAHEQMTPASLARAQTLLLEELKREQEYGADPERTVRIETECYHKNGSKLWLENIVSPIRDEKGSIIAIHGVSRDITKRKKTEEALRASEGRFRALIENSLDAIAVLDAEGRILYKSQSEERILGYKPEHLVGKNFVELIHPDDVERAVSIVQAVKERPGMVLDCQLRCKHKDGSCRPVEGTAHNLLDDPKIKGIVVNYRDVTKHKKVARQLEESIRKLESVMEATIKAISSTMETRDPYTAGHQRRVTQLACAIAKEMGLPVNQIDGIRVAGLLHDIGKISIPTEILSKPGRLTETEFAMIKSHAEVGYDILKTIDFNWPIAKTVLQHHERINGSGYPAGIRGEEILLEARILAVADVVEAMSSHRPYRPSLGLERALDDISRGAGTLYDLQAVNACLMAFRESGFRFEG